MPRMTKPPSHPAGVLPGGAPAIPPPDAQATSLAGVRVTYPGADRAALAFVSVATPAGAFVGVVGRTGNGKTSLRRLVVRAIAPSAGRVRHGGVDLDLVPEVELRARVTGVGQDPSLFHASVRENVTLFNTAVTDATVQAALMRVGMGDRLAAQPDGLRTRLAPPGGQGRRHPSLAVAQATARLRGRRHVRRGGERVVVDRRRGGHWGGACAVLPGHGSPWKRRRGSRGPRPSP